MSPQHAFQEVILPRLLAVFACFPSRLDMSCLILYSNEYIAALPPSLLLGDVLVCTRLFWLDSLPTSLISRLQVRSHVLQACFRPLVCWWGYGRGNVFFILYSSLDDWYIDLGWVLRGSWGSRGSREGLRRGRHRFSRCWGGGRILREPQGHLALIFVVLQYFSMETIFV